MLQTVASALHAFKSLREHAHVLGETVASSVENTVGDLERRLARKELYVCVAGEKKSGKSTFLNAILGERVLGAAAREFTGTVTEIRRADRFNYLARFNDGSVEEFSWLLPDRDAEFLAAITGLEAQLQKTQDLLAHCRGRAEHARKEFQEESAADADCLCALEEARNNSERACGELQAAGEKKRQSAITLADSLQKLPFFFRRQPFRWEFWLWLPRWICFFAWKSARQAVRDSELQLSQMRAQIPLLESKANAVNKSMAAALERCEQQSARLAEATAKQTEMLRLLEASESELARMQLDLLHARELRTGHATERKNAFLGNLRALTDIEMRAESVTELKLEYPAKHLPDNIVMLDTPGINTDNDGNRQRAWAAIRRDADGCILVSDIQQAVSQSTKDFVRELREVVPHLILVLTKLDRALQNAEDTGQGDSHAQVEEARRKGVHEFARQVGRDAESVLSAAVAALPALLDGEASSSAAAQFAAEAEKIFNLLKRERNLMIASRAANATQLCMAGISAVQRAAEASYCKRIGALEEQQIPNPEEFIARQLQRIDADIKQRISAMTQPARMALDDRFTRLLDELGATIWRCENRAALRACVDNIECDLAVGIQQGNDELNAQQAQCMHAAVQELEQKLLEELQARYRIATRLSGNTRAGEMVLVCAAAMQVETIPIYVNMSEILGADFFSDWVLNPLKDWFLGMDGPKRQCMEKLLHSLEECKRGIARQLDQQEPAQGALMRNSLSHVLRQSVHRFQDWIASAIKNEQTLIVVERDKLVRLVNLGTEMKILDTALQQQMQAAFDESLGLGRRL